MMGYGAESLNGVDLAGWKVELLMFSKLIMSRGAGKQSDLQFQA
jgi:hypothetical protein